MLLAKPPRIDVAGRCIASLRSNASQLDGWLGRDRATTILAAVQKAAEVLHCFELAEAGCLRMGEQTIPWNRKPTRASVVAAAAGLRGAIEAVAGRLMLADDAASDQAGWQPPAGYIGRKAINAKYGTGQPPEIPDGTFAGWARKDNPQVVADPRTSERYYPEDWVSGRAAKWRPGSRTPIMRRPRKQDQSKTVAL
jgi:hypothetical protein